MGGECECKCKFLPLGGCGNITLAAVERVTSGAETLHHSVAGHVFGGILEQL